MVAYFPQKVTLVELIPVFLAIDRELAEQIKFEGCPRCGGKLDWASYPRKPRGFPLDKESSVCRLSLCCREEGCRHRVLPPSCLFFDRKVYWSCIFLISVAVRQLSVKTAEQVHKRFGIPVRTLRRWMVWFREVYLQSESWLRRQGFLSLSHSPKRAMGGLYKYFLDRGGEPDGLGAFVRFMTIAG
jgi:hypothetical protein